ncbi:MAG TPA: hypothetical protein DDY13_16220 [Cytophagales bacterium]|nr:hypothetical protein [Cytophagales bacterium]
MVRKIQDFQSELNNLGNLPSHTRPDQGDYLYCLFYYYVYEELINTHYIKNPHFNQKDDELTNNTYQLTCLLTGPKTTKCKLLNWMNRNNAT